MTNSAGLKYHYNHGFGNMNAETLVAGALEWTNLAPQITMAMPATTLNVPLKASNTFSFTVKSACVARDSKDNEDAAARRGDEGCLTCIESLEHVQLLVTVEGLDKRGALKIVLEHPSGSRSELMRERHNDRSRASIVDWPYMSLMHWGEDVEGEWKVHIEYSGQGGKMRPGQTKPDVSAPTLVYYQAIFYGAATEECVFEENPCQNGGVCFECQESVRAVCDCTGTGFHGDTCTEPCTSLFEEDSNATSSDLPVCVAFVPPSSESCTLEPCHTHDRNPRVPDPRIPGDDTSHGGGKMDNGGKTTAGGEETKVGGGGVDGTSKTPDSTSVALFFGVVSGVALVGVLGAVAYVLWRRLRTKRTPLPTIQSVGLLDGEDDDVEME